MIFEHPWSLLGLIILIPLLLVFRRSDKRSKKVLEALKAPVGHARFQFFRFLLVAGFLALLTVVSARPYATPGVTGDYIFLVDTSRSMQASNFCGEPTFLDRARAVVLEILAGIPEGRFGIMVFDRLAFPVTSMTYDHAYLRDVLDQGVYVGMTYDATRTNLPNALQAVASKKQELPGIYGDVRQVILISDGLLREEDWRQQLSDATNRLRQTDTTVVALGIGNTEATPIHLTNDDGECLEESIEIGGNVIRVALVRDTLIKATEDTQGRYFDEHQVVEAVEYLREAGLLKAPPVNTEWHEEQRRYLGGTFLVLATLALILLLVWERRSL